MERDFIFENISKAPDKIYVSMVRSWNTDADCPPPSPANDDWPTAAPSAGQTNQWEDESPTQQYSKPFNYVFYLLSKIQALFFL